VIVGLHLLDNVWIAIVGYHLGIVVVITASGHWPLARRLVRGWSALAVIGLVPLFAAAGAAIFLAWPFARLEQVELMDLLGRYGLGSGAFAFFAWYSVINPWLEELYWRGLLLVDSARPAAVDALFGGYHAIVLILFVSWPWAVAGFVALSAAAWIWRLLARRFDGLLVPVVTHAVADVSIIIAVYALSLGYGVK
jgi:membrane protease YdiL (CAAX protease family)